QYRIADAADASKAKRGSEETEGITRRGQVEGSHQEEIARGTEHAAQVEIFRGVGGESVDGSAGAAGFEPYVPGCRRRGPGWREPEYNSREPLCCLCGPDAALDFAEMAAW